MTLPLWLFALVWLAAWAACWFALAPLWPRRLVLEGAGFDQIVCVEAQRFGRSTWQLERCAQPPGTRIRITAIGQRKGVRDWAPLIATACALLADLVATVLA